MLTFTRFSEATERDRADFARGFLVDFSPFPFPMLSRFAASFFAEGVLDRPRGSLERLGCDAIPALISCAILHFVFLMLHILHAAGFVGPLCGRTRHLIDIFSHLSQLGTCGPGILTLSGRYEACYLHILLLRFHPHPCFPPYPHHYPLHLIF